MSGKAIVEPTAQPGRKRAAPSAPDGIREVGTAKGRPVSPRTLTQIQRTAGNAAACHLLRQTGTTAVQRSRTGANALASGADVLQRAGGAAVPGLSGKHTLNFKHKVGLNTPLGPLPFKVTGIGLWPREPSRASR